MAKDKDDNIPEEPVVRDKRRIDPETGDVRPVPTDGGEGAEAEASAPQPDAEAGASREEVREAPVEAADGLSEEDLALLDQSAQDIAAELRQDLQRLQAEYANYRRRSDREREALRDVVVAEVVKGLLPALDDLRRAEAHGDLEGSPLAIVAQKLRNGFDRFGLTPIGEKGEPFDPAVHEAIAQLPTPDAEGETVADVVELGYRIGERLLRPAKVAVAVPQS